MKRKIVTFTMSLRQSQFEVDRLEEEARKLGVGVNRALYRELSFELENEKSVVTIRGEKVTSENTLGMWFRVAGTVSGKYTEGRNMAIRILQSRIFCANHNGYLGWTRMGKIAQHAVFVEQGIPVIPTRIFYTKEQVLQSRIGEEFGWPIIAKHERGYQGKSVRKFENFEELEKFVTKIDEKNIGMFLWQKYLPTRWDLRVIVLGGKVIGAMKRTAVGSEFRSNFSLGGAVEAWELSDTDKELAEKVARVCGLDYCGVDIMKSSKVESSHKGTSEGSQKSKGIEYTIYREEDYDSYVLEVNRQCQFQGFEKSTGINVAKLVVDMFLKNA